MKPAKYRPFCKHLMFFLLEFLNFF